MFTNLKIRGSEGEVEKEGIRRQVEFWEVERESGEAREGKRGVWEGEFKVVLRVLWESNNTIIKELISCKSLKFEDSIFESNKSLRI